MIDIYTDGACLGTPGPGGWAAIIIENGTQRQLHGRDAATTNNRMEILATIKGIADTPLGEEVTVYSDSTYVINTMTRNWKRNANKDLWVELDAVVARRQISWQWVKGHSGHPLNEAADKLANTEAHAISIDEEPIPVAGGDLTHVDSSGKANMVDVGSKAATERIAVAKGRVVMRPQTLNLIQDNAFDKGDVLGVARVAGITGAKHTSDLIPLCHPLPLDAVQVEFQLNESTNAVEITATVKTTAKTGVEMEALTSVATAALTIYDMCKSVDSEMQLQDIRLVLKTGGSSGDLFLEKE